MKKINYNELEEGYFKAPDFIFQPQLSLSLNARYIFIYLCRRANKKGASHPSLDRMSRDTKIKSHTTLRKALRELEQSGFIEILKPKRRCDSNTYVINQNVLKFYSNSHMQPDCNKHKIYRSNNDSQYTNNDDIYSNNELEYSHIMTAKEYSVKEDSIKEIIDDLSEEDIHKRVKEHMKTLSPDGCQRLVSNAKGRAEYSCKPKNNSIELDRLILEIILEYEVERINDR